MTVNHLWPAPGLLEPAGSRGKSSRESVGIEFEETTTREFTDDR